MKNTLFWKWFDLIGQLVMALPIICIVSPYSAGNALIAYFTVGAWQGISCAVWAANTGALRSAVRRPMGILFSIILGLFIGCMLIRNLPGLPEQADRFFSDIAGIEAVVMLFLGPVMAIAYAAITLDEIGSIRSALKHRSELQWRQV